jgi:hypothetical protein
MSSTSALVAPPPRSARRDLRRVGEVPAGHAPWELRRRGARGGVAPGRSGGADLRCVGEVQAALAIERPVHRPELPVVVQERSVDVARTPSFGGLGGGTEAEPVPVSEVTMRALAGQ